MTKRDSERGNIFFALFGAVALVGVIGAATSTLMRGPVSTVMSVNQRTKADTQMQIASKLAMVRAAQEAAGGDCEGSVDPLQGDGTIEPIPPDAMAGLTGGGALPATIGASQIDPWNTKYGYCAWDLGAVVDHADCGGPGVRRVGGNNMSYPVMVIISAGPDKAFQTSCNDWVDTAPADDVPDNATTLIDTPAGSDDIILSFTYSEAVQAAGGLWSLMSGDPNKITTDKDVAFSSGTDVDFSAGTTANFQGTAQFADNSRLDMGLGGLFLLPDEVELPDGDCNAGNNGALRINRSSGFNILEMCDPATGGFVALGGAGATVTKIDDLTDAKSTPSEDTLFLGDSAGLNYSSGAGATNNLGVGIGAASNLTTGTGNLVLGNNSTLGGATNTDSVVIGHGVVGGGSDTLKIGNFLSGSNIYNSSGSLAVGGGLNVGGTAQASRFEVDGTVGYIDTTGANLILGTGGSPNVTVESGGNVGIGIADPSVSLDVSGDAQADHFLAGSGSAGGPSFSFGSGSGLGMYNAGGSALGFATGGANRVTIDDDGLGIGTSPSVALDVSGAGAFTSSVTAGSFQFTSGQGMFPAGGGINLAGGNVGIGQASPATTLDVNGEIRIGGSVATACTAAIVGAIRFASGDQLEVCLSTNVWAVVGADSGGGSGSGSNWTKLSDDRLYYNQNFVGVGTADPLADFHTGGNLLVTGTFGAGDTTPVSGAGTRMMFVPNKGAFRAGTVSGTQWNHANIGDYSLASGYDVLASGAGAVSLGNEATASGANSFAFGLGNPATNPIVSGDRSFGIFMGNQAGVDVAADNVMTLLGGSLVIDPDTTAPATSLNISRAGMGIDVQGDIGAMNYCDEDGTDCFTAADIVGGGVGVWEDVSNVIRLTSGTVNYASADFVFGSPQLDDVGDATHDSRVIFDKDLGAFRAGNASGTQWDVANRGLYSMAIGNDVTASALASIAMGESVAATGNTSIGLGHYSTASGADSIAIGHGLTADGNYSLALGMRAEAMGLHSMAIGLGQAAGAYPAVTGDNALGIFMGDQSAVSFASSNRFGLFGGRMIIDPAVPATQITTSGTLSLDVEGQVGATEYCDENGLNCFTAGGVSSGSFAAGNDRELQFNSNGSLGADTNLVFTSAGRLGIGTNAPAAPLHVVDDFVVTGGFTDTASVPVSGAGTRMFFDPHKAAFRAGQVTGTQWDNGSIGGSSVAMGWDVTASGGNSVSLGTNSTASGFASVALGYNNISFGSNALGIGNDTRARGDYSVVIGNNSFASGEYSLALGRGVVAGDYDENSGSGDGSLAIGLVDNAITISSAPRIEGIQSMGVFMGDQNGSVMTTNNTVGFFGGRMVIDPREPASQLTARSVLDLGAASDAVVMPIGDTGQRPASPVNGMLRYNSANGKFEGYQAGAWQDILTGAASSTFLSLTDTPASYAGEAGKFVRVNAGTNALEFTDEIVRSVTGEPAPDYLGLNDLLDVDLSVAPTEGQFLQYDSASGLWAAGTASAASVTAAGADTQLQFNSGGNFAAQSSLTYNRTESWMYVDGTPLNEAGVLVIRGNDNPAEDYNDAILSLQRGTTSEVWQMSVRNNVPGYNGDLGLSYYNGSTWTTPLSMTTGQKIGMFTTNPTTTLDVRGNIRVGYGLEACGATVAGGVRYNSATGKLQLCDGLAWADVGSDIDTFLDLTDTPASYAGSASQYVRVNAATNALEFTDQIVGTVSGEPAPTFMALDDLSDVDLSIAPTNGQSLTYNGTSWVAGIADSAPAGANMEVQFNSNGSFGAVPGFMWTGTGLQLHAGNINKTTSIVPTSVSGPAALTLTANNNGTTSNIAIISDDGIEMNVLGTEYFTLSSSGNLGLGSTTPLAKLDIGGTGAMLVPRGDTGQRPTGVNGMLRYNSANGKFEGYQAGSWQDILTGAATGTFLSLTDTPASYAGAATQYVRVNAGTNALEFTDEIVGTITGQPAPDFMDLDALSDVDLSVAPTDGQALVYSSASGTWIAGSGGSGGGAINDLSDAKTDYAVDYNLLIGTPADAWAIAATGTYNLALGQLAGDSITDGDRNLAIGYNALTTVTTAADNMAIGYQALTANTVGYGNTGIGDNALSTNVGSKDNTAIGFEAMRYANSTASTLNAWDAGNTALGAYALRGSTTAANNTGTFNTAIGGNAMKNATSAENSVAVGAHTLEALTTGNYNTAVGSLALKSVVTGQLNAAFGYAALMNNTGSSNTALGYRTLMSNTTGDGNTAVGYQALDYSSSGGNNTAVGKWAAFENRDGQESTAIGSEAMMNANSATGLFVTYNTAVGFRALKGSGTPAANTGIRNNAFGHSALQSVTAGRWNQAFGYSTLGALTTGDDNAAFGDVAMQNATTATENVAVGSNTMQSNRAKNENVAIGFWAMKNYTDNTSSANTNNVAIGTYAMRGSATVANNTGTNNVAIGHSAMLNFTSGSGNTAVGYHSMLSNSIGTENAAFGYDSLNSNTTGNKNTAIGYLAMDNNLTGGANTAIGYRALDANDTNDNTAVGAWALAKNSSGTNNTGIGRSALYENLTSNNNTALGYQALGNTTGASNTAIGSSAGRYITTGDGNIMIGHNVDALVPTGDNQLNIGNTIYGDMATGNIAVNGTAALTVPRGDTGQRPTGVNGMIRYNSATAKFEAYQAGAWIDMIGGGGGGTFLGLTDTPASYAASGNKYVRVNTGATALEFTDEIVGTVSGQPAPNFIDLDDLSDVNLSVAPTNGQVLSFNGTSWVAAAAGSGGSALSTITAATSTPTALANAAFTQTWNWALTGAAADAFTFGESAASTGGAGDQSILKSTTLAASTAIPLMVTNLGAGLSLRVNDETGDTDASPFVINNAGRAGIGTASPAAKLDVQGAVQIGNDSETCSSAADLGNIRFNNAAFEICRDIVMGWELLVGAGGGGACDSTQSYATAGTYSYAVPDSFGTLTIRMWGGGGGGGGSGTSASAGNSGGNTTIFSRSLVAGGGGGGGGSNPAAGSAGSAGTASGGDTNTNGNAGEAAVEGVRGGKGGNAPGIGGGVGGAAVSGVAVGLAGSSPGAGGSGSAYSAQNSEAGGGGSGAYLEIVYTQAELPPSTIITDLVVGAAGTGGSGMTVGGIGAAGKIVVSCASAGAPLPGADNEIAFFSGGNLTSNANFVFAGGEVGIGTASPAATLDITATDAIILPRGTTAERPGTPANGMIRYNSATAKFEAYQAGAWIDMIGGGGIITTISGQPLPSFIALSELDDVDLSVAPNNGEVLSFNGTSWVAAAAGGGSGTAAGSQGEIQFNSGGAFASNPFFTIEDDGYSTRVGINHDVMTEYTDASLVVAAANTSDQIRWGQTWSNSGSIVGYLGFNGSTPSVSMEANNSHLDLISGYYDTNNYFIRVFKGDNTGNSTQSVIQFYRESTGGAGAVNNGGSIDTYLESATNNTFRLGSRIDTIATTATAASFASKMVLVPRFNNADTTGMTLQGATGAVTWVGINNTAPSVALDVTGDVEYSGILTDVSDMRLKTDIHPLRDRGSMLNRLGQIETYSFRMKDDKEGQVEFGVMAQDMQKIFPELVRVDTSTPENYLSVNYLGMIAPLVEATQELKAENDNLKAQLSTLETRLASIESDMNGMKAHTGYGISKAGFGMGMAAGLGLIGGLGGVALFRRRRKAA
ncbi:MAG: tail fiber domain-containing protein [Micavibrio sp.]